jgi:hypothetical protein
VGPGAGDNAAAALGLGVTSGDLVISIGTSGTVFGTTDLPIADSSGAVAGFASADGGRLPLVATLNAARVLDSAATLLRVSHDELAALALASRPGANGLTLVPYFEGERTPNLPDATARLEGMTLANSSAENVARAFVEGMLCGLADGLDAVQAQGLEAGGCCSSAGRHAILPSGRSPATSSPCPSTYPNRPNTSPSGPPGRRRGRCRDLCRTGPSSSSPLCIRVRRKCGSSTGPRRHSRRRAPSRPITRRPKLTSSEHDRTLIVRAHVPTLIVRSITDRSPWIFGCARIRERLRTMATVTFDKALRQYPEALKPSVDEISLDIADGEFLVLVGPSGCGKSTTLRMLAGLEPVDSGHIRIGDHDVTDLSPRERDIAMVFQNYALYPHMSVRENMAFRPEDRGSRRSRNAISASRRPPACSTWRRTSTASRRPCPAGSGSVWRWVEPSSGPRRSSSWTSRCRTSMRSCGCRPARRSPP